MGVKKQLTFVTKNKEKILDITTMLGDSIQLSFEYNIELTEIQSLSVEEVVAFKAKEAFEILKKPVAVSDSGLEIITLKKFPGALVKFVNETIGQDGIAKLMEGENERTAYFVAAIAYYDEENGSKVFVQRDEGTIAEKPRGKGWHFDKLFIPKGETRTWAEIGRLDKNIHSAFKRALTTLAKWLQNDKK
ncbi:MAG: non-canonical purine NTP pyrophosphatase [Candidatus Heimdallarchaeota archaeon]